MSISQPTTEMQETGAKYITSSFKFILISFPRGAVHKFLAKSCLITHTVWDNERQAMISYRVNVHVHNQKRKAQEKSYGFFSPRVRAKGLKLTRPAIELGRYTMLGHGQGDRNGLA